MRLRAVGIRAMACIGVWKLTESKGEHMRLKCQSSGVRCPTYEHQGVFAADTETVKSFFPDLHHCAACMSQTPPKRLDLKDDLFQVAALTLIDTGPKFDPSHESGASFRSFIRVRICGTLMDAKQREVKQSQREVPMSYAPVPASWDCEGPTAVLEVADPRAAFEDRLAEDLSIAAILPMLLKCLTPRERDVLTYLRQEWQHHEIADVLNLSKGRVSQLVGQIRSKVATVRQRIDFNV